MFIEIGKKIKKHREEKNVTQDAFAQFLGVNCKDVVKWEDGDIYPQFELIPVIAKYFGVTADELLCMEMFGNEERIRGIIDGFQASLTAGNVKEAVEIIRAGLVHFPKVFRLKCLLMYGLYLSCDRPAVVKHYSAELIAIGEDILSNCTEDSIRLEAKRILCLHYFEDLADTENARETALSLPARKLCREDMLPSVSEGESKLAAIQENISAYTSLLAAAISDYTENAKALSAREKIELCETARTIRKAVYTRGDLFENTYAHMTLLKNLAVLYMSADEPEKALDCLDECARFAAAFDAMPKTAVHISPLVNRIRFNKNQAQVPKESKNSSFRDIFMEEIIALQCFEPVRYNSRITDICRVFTEKN